MEGPRYVVWCKVSDHPPLHVHVLRDGRRVARYDLENQKFLEGSDPRHRGRVLAALREIGLAQ